MKENISVTYYKGEVDISDGYNSLVVEINDCKFIHNCITLSQGREKGFYLDDSMQSPKFALHVVATCDKLLISTEVAIPRNRPIIFEAGFYGVDTNHSLKTKLNEVISNVEFPIS